MIEVHPGLFVGADADALVAASEAGWYVIHAAKEPWHRAALGYTSKGAPKGHPEYLFAYRPGSLALNLIDAPDPEMIPTACIDEALDAIDRALLDECKVLVHCNQGHSRAPGIAFLWLSLRSDTFDACTYDQAITKFREIYPAFAPAAGIAGYVEAIWSGVTCLSGAIDALAAEIEHDIPEREEPRRPASRAIFKL